MLHTTDKCQFFKHTETNNLALWRTRLAENVSNNFELCDVCKNKSQSGICYCRIDPGAMPKAPNMLDPSNFHKKRNKLKRTGVLACEWLASS